MIYFSWYNCYTVDKWDACEYIYTWSITTFLIFKPRLRSEISQIYLSFLYRNMPQFFFPFIKEKNFLIFFHLRAQISIETGQPLSLNKYVFYTYFVDTCSAGSCADDALAQGPTIFL